MRRPITKGKKRFVYGTRLWVRYDYRVNFNKVSQKVDEVTTPGVC